MCFPTAQALVKCRASQKRGATYGQDVGVEAIHVDHGVDAGISESSHTTLVISFGIYVVNPNRVGAERLHQGSILLALRRIGQWVVYK